ncbi:MAG: hypothetical protein EHM45_17125 [Desulfobacteraceae bacterium]|nr:MAG: hypothetical protein EHM45_17125 [Desulfobacteraceae bacterium]
MKKLIIVTVFFINTIVFGQTNDLPNREPFTLKLAVDDTIFYQAEIKSAPYVLPENHIQIYPGEKILVEVELIENEIVSMKPVKENLNPEKTITITFTQQVDEKKHKFMMSAVYNPFGMQLEYQVNMYLMKYKKWAPTHVLPIKAKSSVSESWPNILTFLDLYGWQFK